MVYWMETQLIVGLNGKQQSAAKDWGGGCSEEKAIHSHHAEKSTQFLEFSSQVCQIVIDASVN